MKFVYANFLNFQYIYFFHCNTFQNIGRSQQTPIILLCQISKYFWNSYSDFKKTNNKLLLVISQTQYLILFNLG